MYIEFIEIILVSNHISRKYAGQGSYDFRSFSFSEKIGFTKMHRDEINQGIRTIELWQLKYYNLK